MNKILLTGLLMIFAGALSFAQTSRLKGNGQVFWEESFNWENPADPKGWTAPPGWLIEDHSSDNNGIVWTWTKDSLQGPMSKRDGGYILNSATRSNGFLAIDLDNHNAYKNYLEMLYVNSSITLPLMNFSNHPSVIISFDQMFKYFNSPKMIMEVSNDNGRHWAEYDLRMGTPRGVNTLNLPNTGIAHYSANISEVAGGQPQVTIRITWSGSILYFWMLDDMTLAEGWDYDLKMNHWQVEMTDPATGSGQGFFHMIPKTQILPMGNFIGSVVNYGDQEQTGIRFEAEVLKNGTQQFLAASNPVSSRYYGDPADTLSIVQKYTPAEYGHYQLTLRMASEQEDQNPDNNRKSWYFHVTDSVFARTPEVSEADESPWRDYYQYPHDGDFMGVEFNPVADCEASSLSVYISRANIDTEFKAVLMEIDETGETPEMIELLSSTLVAVDSALLQAGWITLPFELDGLGEKMRAGKRYFAGIQFWTYVDASNLANRRNSFWIGSTKSYPGSFDKQWSYQTWEQVWRKGSSFNKMIRLNINNHDNRIDGIPGESVSDLMGQNYPNPFSGSTTLTYTLEQMAPVRLDIRDITGRVVMSSDQGIRSAGSHSLRIDGSRLSPGQYSYTLTAGSYRETKIMVVR